MLNKHHHAIIMAGGIGSRFWPLSRQSKPKQFLDIMGTGKSLIQMTFERLALVVPKNNIWVVSHLDYKQLVKEQIPELKEDQILLEPLRKNTAPCVLYAAKAIELVDPEAKLFIAPSDHLILNEIEFKDAILQAFHFIEKYPDHLLTFGIKASRPDTGYGYINFNQDAGFEQGIYPVNRFVEKPDLQTAKDYLAQGDYVWNSGMFLWSVNTIQAEMKKYAPALYHAFEGYSNFEDILRIYETCSSDSIDYAIMEKSTAVVVKTVDFGWSDLGTWASLYEIHEKDVQENVSLMKNGLLSKSNSNLIRDEEGKLIVVHGMKDLMLINTKDVLLVCHRYEEQAIKQLVAEIDSKFGNASL